MSDIEATESEAVVETTSGDVNSEAIGTTEDTSLRVSDLRKRFGGIIAVDGTSFSVESGSITGLIGPNGAGKSTTFDLITGLQRPDAGSIEFDGEDITDLEPHQVANRGLVRTFQIAREFPRMTVLENMMLAPRNQLGEALWRSVLPSIPRASKPGDTIRNRLADVLPKARSAVVQQEETLLERAWETLEFFEIDHLALEEAGNLSGGQRKLLEFARALLTEPRMLLLDEPMAGVNPSLERKLLEHVHRLQSEGYTFLLVEHDMDVIMNHCESVIVMHQGRVLAEGPPAKIRDNEEVIEAYLGEDL